MKEKRLLLAAVRIPAASQQGDDFIECRSRQVSIGIGLGVALIKCIHVPFLGRDFRDDLLGQNVLGVLRDKNFVQVAAMNRANQRRAFHQFVTGRTQETSFWNRPHPVTGPADSLQAGGNRARRTHLAHEIHKADVDAQFQGRRRNDHASLSFLEAFFSG